MNAELWIVLIVAIVVSAIIAAVVTNVISRLPPTPRWKGKFFLLMEEDNLLAPNLIKISYYNRRDWGWEIPRSGKVVGLFFVGYVMPRVKFRTWNDGKYTDHSFQLSEEYHEGWGIQVKLDTAIDINASDGEIEIRVATAEIGSYSVVYQDRKLIKYVEPSGEYGAL